MDRIYFYNTKYHWDSYSIVRSTFEELQRQYINVISINNLKKCDIKKNSFLFLFDSKIKLTKETYNNYKNNNVKVIKFNVSDPTFFDEEKIKNCDLYCTNDLNIYEAYKDTYNCYYYKTSCDINYHKKLNIKKEYDVVFIGSCTHPTVKFRKEWIDKLRDSGIYIKVFGNSWPDYPNNHSFIKNENIIKEYNKAHINLDLTTKKSSLGRRIFEAGGCGTPSITFKRKDVLQSFEENKEILLYESYEELKNKLIYYLNKKNLLAEIADNVLIRCIENHDISYRVRDLLIKIEGLLV